MTGRVSVVYCDYCDGKCISVPSFSVSGWHRTDAVQAARADGDGDTGADGGKLGKGRMMMREAGGELGHATSPTAAQTEARRREFPPS